MDERSTVWSLPNVGIKQHLNKLGNVPDSHFESHLWESTCMN